MMGATAVRFSERLYVGKKAEQKRDRILQGLREGALQPQVYVLIPAKNGNNLLDIYPCAMLKLPGFPDADPLVVGVAVTYWEALEVARQIVDELYRETGGFCLKDLLGEG